MAEEKRDAVTTLSTTRSASGMDPERLAADMQHMAKLHPSCLWAVAMAEGAEMIRALYGESG